MSDTLNNCNKLEQMLFSSPSSDFPQFSSAYEANSKPFCERYDLLKTKLGDKHDNVEIGALLASAKKGVPYDSLVYLNQHGKGHIEVVMNRAAKLVDIIQDPHRLTGFELFLLCCAIQIHDIGNISGRENHTVSFRSEFFRIAPECFITEPGLKEMIFSIACVHGGIIKGDNDTISQLYRKATLLDQDVRPQLLAAILRFADELADDCTRAKELDEMPGDSKIFHAYSKTLHTVSIKRNEYNDAYHVYLCYYLSQEEATQRYKRRNKKEISLIEEILNRMEKTECERRYCVRFLLPHIVITEVKVDIGVQFPNEISLRNHVYTLSESGYPSARNIIQDRERMRIIQEVTGRGVNSI